MRRGVSSRARGSRQGHPATPVLEQGVTRGESADVRYHPEEQDASYWIPGSSAPALPEKQDALLRLWKTKDFKEESMTQVGLYAIGTATTLESNKSLHGYHYPLSRARLNLF